MFYEVKPFTFIFVGKMKPKNQNNAKSFSTGYNFLSIHYIHVP